VNILGALILEKVSTQISPFNVVTRKQVVNNSYIKTSNNLRQWIKIATLPATANTQDIVDFKVTGSFWVSAGGNPQQISIEGFVRNRNGFAYSFNLSGDLGIKNEIMVLCYRNESQTDVYAYMGFASFLLLKYDIDGTSATIYDTPTITTTEPSGQKVFESGVNIPNGVLSIGTLVAEELSVNGYSVGSAPLITQIYTFYQNSYNVFQPIANDFMKVAGILDNSYASSVVSNRSRVSLLPYSMSMCSDSDGAVGNTTFSFELRVQNNTSKVGITVQNSTVYALVDIQLSDLEIDNVLWETPVFGLYGAPRVIPANTNWGIILTNTQNNVANYEVVVKVFFSQVV